MQEAVTADAWNEELGKKSSITVEELDALALLYKEAWDKHDEAEKVKKDLYNKGIEIEQKLIEALELAGKGKYVVEGIGTFSFVDKMSVQTPKTIGDKQKLGKWLEEQGGKTYFWEVFGVNSNTLQSLYRKSFDEYVGKNPDNAAMFHIPGLASPTNQRSLRLLKEKAKKAVKK